LSDINDRACCDPLGIKWKCEGTSEKTADKIYWDVDSLEPAPEGDIQI
jgi:hypothetical protein